MKSKTLGLFIFSGLTLIGTLSFSIFRTNFGVEANYTVSGAIATVAFGLSIAGLVIGVGEVRNSKTIRIWIGLIGNLIIVGLFLLMIVSLLK